jgi:hypothetical protein
VSPSLILKYLADLPRRVKAAFLLGIDFAVLCFAMLLAFAVRFDPTTLEHQIRNCCSSEAGSKRTAKASSIAKHSTTKSKHIKKAALTLRGKSAKDFSIKLGDTIL